MPRFFGLWDHLQNEDAKGSLEMAKAREPIEILGTVAYLNAYSQNFEPLPRPEGIGEWSEDEKIARGKARSANDVSRSFRQQNSGGRYWEGVRLRFDGIGG